MINPIIYTFNIFGNEFPLRWYGIIVVVGMFVGAWIVERELKRRGENSELIWDALVWILIPGIIGARLWYVFNATLGGDTTFTQNPSEILRIWNGGLHFFGGLLFGAVALLTFLRWNKLDPWLFLDAAGPAIFIGQAIGRIANFVNQELYGPPTTLPWGLRIYPTYGIYQVPVEVEGRSSQEILSYLETTRFHPTFAYEMLWNFLAAGLLMWLSRRYEKDLKPGALFSGWLLLAGFGRVVIEFFRPDQPKIEALGISYSAIVAALMAIAGAVMLMARYKAIRLQVAEDWEDEYQLSTKVKPGEIQSVAPIKIAKTSVKKASVSKDSVKKESTPKTAVSSKKLAREKPDRTPDIKTQVAVRAKRTTKTSVKKKSK